MQSPMSNERGGGSRPSPTGDRPYRTYRAEGQGAPEDERVPPGRTGGSRAGGGDGGRDGARPYRLYRAAPRGLLERLRGEDYAQIRPTGGARPEDDPYAPEGSGRRRRRPPTGPWWRRQLTPRRAIAWVLGAIVSWLLLSLVLFIVSVEVHTAGIPANAQRELAPAGNMLTSTDTILVLGTDQRPKGTHEAGANTSDKGSRSDTIMLWRVGGGVSRRLSIPRDAVAAIPGYGSTKINAAYAYGGPALAIKTVEQFTGVQVNHVIIVNLAAFPKFIDAIGGIDVKTGRICSKISGGAAQGGWTLDLRPGVHHLNGTQALVLARTRENSCNAASNDLTREGYQQVILNSIKSKLASPTSFFHLPWASWYAPETLRTDMGPATLMSLFAAAEIGGSAPTDIFKSNQYSDVTLPDGESALQISQSALRSKVRRLLNG
jgi:LCP family protein required for cell wall assembly